MFFSKKFSISQLILATLFCASQESYAQQNKEDKEDWGVYGQFTNVTQWHPAFRAAYTGDNSLNPARNQQETVDITLYVGHRLWQGGELWLNPEIDQGFGLSNTLGMAGYPSGEAYKVGANTPYLRLPRAFIRQSIDLGGTSQTVDAAVNQMSGARSENNLVITIGHFSVVDIFDNNTYAHDPRSDFLNWSIIDAGTFDYAADAWGFTNGMALEWNQSDWTVRGGVFQLSSAPNSKIAGLHLHQQSWVTELEKRTAWMDLPGKIKLMAFTNRGDMAKYQEAIQKARGSGSVPDVSAVRRFSSRSGIAFNLEQSLSTTLGAFVRASVNQGDKEAYEFTEINRSLSAGLSMQGANWGRTEDRLGLAFVVNALSGAAQNYFAKGGMGILIGDGNLSYGKEAIVEAYYSLPLAAYAKLSVDYQHVKNPAYNMARGPVDIYALRLHSEF
jgi:high affinity Mn2+ porin